MTRKPEIQYIGQFYVHGSEARQLELLEKKKQPKTRLPIAKLEKIEKVYVDPVALVAIAVSVFMLVSYCIFFFNFLFYVWLSHSVVHLKLLKHC